MSINTIVSVVIQILKLHKGYTEDEHFCHFSHEFRPFLNVKIHTLFLFKYSKHCRTKHLVLVITYAINNDKVITYAINNDVTMRRQVTRGRSWFNCNLLRLDEW